MSKPPFLKGVPRKALIFKASLEFEASFEE
jgi:hypothetical protein